MSTSKEILADFTRFLRENEDAGVAVAAIRTLTRVVQRSSSSTMLGLTLELKTSKDALENETLEIVKSSSISLRAACELFLRYVARTALDFAEDFNDCKLALIERGDKFAEIAMKSRKRIAESGKPFVRDGNVVMTHGDSRVVRDLLFRAAQTKNFSVIVPEGRPECSGYNIANRLAAAGIPVHVIVDSAVSAYMDKVDMIIVGAEGVMENGGVVNKIGTYQLALAAKAHVKPFYVAAESYKFMRQFPLRQADLGQTAAKTNKSLIPPVLEVQGKAAPEGTPPVKIEPGVDLAMTMASDLTPPHLIELLFTDLGVLTPSAVSDELIKLYL